MAAVNGVCEMANCHRQTPVFFSQEITIRLIKKDKGVMEDKKLTMPMIALRGLTVLPQMTVNFDIIRDKSIAAVEQAMVGDQRVFLATQKQPDEVIPDIDGIFQVGTIGYVKQLVKMPGGMVRVTVEGQERAELLEMEKGEACCTAIVEIWIRSRTIWTRFRKRRCSGS